MTGTENCKMALLAQADFDGELDAAQAAAMEAHRAQCAQCQANYAEFASTREALRAAALRHHVPEGLRRAIAERAGILAAPAATAQRRARWWWPAANFGLGAAVAAILAFLFLAPAQQTLVDQIVADHVRALQPGHLEDVVSTDRHTVKPWFDGKLDFAPPVKDLAAQGFPLEGGRLDYLAGRPVAALVYRHGKHPIDLFVWPAAEGGDGTPRAAEHNGFNLIHFVQDGMTIWAVSDLESGQLADFVRLWRAAS